MTETMIDNEKMELVYLYVERVNGEEYDLHLDFSQDIQIRWDKDKKEFSIKKLENKLPKNFFGNNIANVTAIAGKNGIGKTTIVDVLMTKKNLYHSFLIVYRLKKRFIVEGNYYLGNLRKEDDPKDISYIGYIRNDHLLTV